MNAVQSFQVLGTMALCFGALVTCLYILGGIARLTLRAKRHIFPTKPNTQ